MKYVIKINGLTKTGGPLAMLQLAAKIQSKKSMVILCFDNNDAVQVFQNWVNKYCFGATVITQDYLLQYHESTLIVTETNLASLSNISWSGYKLCYMLSVDNCVALGLRRLTVESSLRHCKNIVKSTLIGQHVPWQKLSEHVDMFICQSHYSMSVLSTTTEKPVYYLGDYIAKDKYPENNPESTLPQDDEIIVCYNPKKGKAYSKLSRIVSRKIEFVPIMNLNEDELVSLFKNCHAYVDFGSQPGKDRLPREAIVCGCPAYILNSGAGLNNSDFPRSGPFRLRIWDLFRLRATIQKGIQSIREDSLLVKTRTANIYLEEDEFTLRVNALKCILEGKR